MPNINSILSSVLFILWTCILCLVIGCSSDPSGPTSERNDGGITSDLSVQNDNDAATLIDVGEMQPDASVDAGCQPIAESEVACDGIDDDCDGTIDEVLEQRCYDGPGGSLGNGLCSAGTQLCENGAWTACSDQIVPAEESCNAFDDDCDGTVDEALFELCDEDAMPGIGTCRPAARLCSDGIFGECSPPIEAVEELCDGLDNDCDGANDEAFADGDMDGIADCVDDDLDNDGRTNERDNCPLIANDTQRDTDTDDVGDACDDDDDGDGTADVDDCGPLDARRFPGSVETCNGLDDDCDDTVDELAEQPCFEGDEALIGIGSCAEGIQTCAEGEWSECQNSVLPESETCDGQDQDCDGTVDEGLEPGWPDEDEDGYGDDTRPPVCPAPQNYSRTPGDCNDEVRTINPGAPDAPDRQYLDENCDGIDGTETEMIFVTDFGEVDEDEVLGTKRNPFSALRPAIDAAAEAGIRYIAVGESAPLTGTLVDGVSIIGGYLMSEGWERAEGRRSLIYSESRGLGTARLYGENLEEPMILANLELRSLSSPIPGESSYGVFIKNAVSLTMYRVNINVDVGGDGLNGTLGVPGLSSGSAGSGAECGGGGGGGVGGVSMCGDGGPGGNGGRGSSNRGRNGSPEACGGGGGSGADALQTGGRGGVGQAGVDGAWGTLGPAAPEPHPTADGWFTGYGGRGGVGASGTAGCGGGGGGGAWWYPSQHGGGGGGGGGAGCGGDGATGGKDGGASIGVFLANVEHAILDDVFIQTQAGGYGGPGGTGGAGGVGGDSGAGSSGDDWPCNIALGPGYGGNGGSGGNGGRGGDGIGGRGGWSVGVVCFQTLPELIDVGIVPGSPGRPLGTNERGQAYFTYGCEP